jgi:hypothetical protein
MSSINIGMGVGQANEQARNHHIGDCDTASQSASARSLEAGNWVVATATSSSRTKMEIDGREARKQRATEAEKSWNKFQ